MHYKKSRTLKFFFLICLFVFYPIFLYSYSWPIKPFSGPHPINAVFGEFRVPYGSISYHFHSGVDIKANNGTPVFSIISGIVDKKGTESIRVGRYKYVHIIPKVNKGDTVQALTDTIGLIRDFGYPGPQGDHLHFMEGPSGGPYNNPLFGLDNYTDNATTSVWGSPDFMFFKQGTNIQLPQNGPIWGKIDLLVREKDAQSNGSSNTGIYRTGYEVINLNNNISFPYIELIKFDDIIGSVGLVYDETRSTNSTYYYWVTNAKDEDRYWNTKLKKVSPGMEILLV